MNIVFDGEKCLYAREAFILRFVSSFCVKNIVLESVFVTENILEGVSGLHEATKRGYDLHEVAETLRSV
jgi:hypothetical protein